MYMGHDARNLSWVVCKQQRCRPASHPHSLISAFAIKCLESIISRLATSEISIFYLVSLAEQAGLILTLSETPKTGFVASRPIYNKPS